jgi:phosphatidylglycerophosphatase A
MDTTTLPDAASTPQTATLRWMLSHPARILAQFFGAGLLRPGPGTWGTLAGWVSWLALLQNRSTLWQIAVILAGFLIGCWACHKAGKDLGIADHGSFVIDEVMAFWLMLWLVPTTLFAQSFAFLLFRLFDIFKPPPIRYFDRRLKNGFGVMFDDLLAAFYALLVFAIGQRIFG